MLTRKQAKINSNSDTNVKLQKESNKPQDVNCKTGKRGRPRKINIVESLHINEEVENEISNKSDETSEINELTRAMESTMIRSTGESFRDVFESLSEEQLFNNFNNETFTVNNFEEKDDYNQDNNDYCNDDDNGEYYDADNVDGANLEVVEPEDANVEKNANLKFIQTNRGGRKLLHNGYSCVSDDGDFDCTFWKCTFSKVVITKEAGKKDKRKYVYCPGRCHSFEDRDIRIITAHNSYFHFPDPVENECLIANENIKLMGKNTEDKPRSMIKKAQINVSKEAAARLNRPSTHMFNRIRSTAETCGSRIQIV